jgi:hypothetical protein
MAHPIPPDDPQADRQREVDQRVMVEHGCCIANFSRGCCVVKREEVVTLRCPTCGYEIETRGEL